MSKDQHGFHIFTGTEHLSKPTDRVNVMIRITEWLKENGFELGTYECFEHVNGLPTGIAVKPNYSEYNGNMTFIVTPTHIFKCACFYPGNTWNVLGKWRYKNKVALKTFLTKAIKIDLGCW